MDEAQNQITFLDYWRVIRRRRTLILGIFFFFVVAAAVISFLMTPIYQAKATLMPVESFQNRVGALLGPLQDLPLIGGAMGGSLTKTATDKLVGILKSRTVAESVIQKLDLVKAIFKREWDGEKMKWKTEEPPTLQDCVKVLQEGVVKVIEDRKGLISVTVDYENPHLAASMANEYLNALQHFLNHTAISQAKRNRIFLEKRLDLTRHDLKENEEALKNFQTEKKIAALDAQAESAIKGLAELKAQIIAREVSLGALGGYATRNHPDVKRFEDELREFRQQMKRLEEGGKNPKRETSSIGALLTLTDAPTVGLEYGRLKRDALIQQKVFELLTQQLELAKIEEAKNDLAFQIIDPAVAPEKRIRPKRAMNVMIAGLASLFLGVFLAFFLEYLDRQRSQGPEGRPRP